MAMSVQERQLVLTEALTKQLQSVLANQQQLSATTEELRRQNAELRKALEETRSTEKQPPNKRRRRSNVNVPDALRVRMKYCWYKVKVRFLNINLLLTIERSPHDTCVFIC